MRDLYEGRIGYHGNIQLKTSGGGVGDQEEETETLILWLVVLELLAGGRWWRGGCL